MTINDLTLKHSIARIHILLIDTEGYDYEILKSIEFPSVLPLVIQYEHANLNEKDQLQAIKLLYDNNYKLISYHLDTIAIHKDILGSLSLFRESVLLRNGSRRMQY